MDRDMAEPDGSSPTGTGRSVFVIGAVSDNTSLMETFDDIVLETPTLTLPDQPNKGIGKISFFPMSSS